MPKQRYEVTFTIESDTEHPEVLIEEAVAAVIDEEIFDDEGTRCGVKFTDAVDFRVSKVS